MPSMLLLGFLSFLQMAFLPGYLLQRVLQGSATPESSPLKTWILSFHLSLLCNFIFVCALVWVGLYRADILYAVFIFETILLIFFHMRDQVSPLHFSMPMLSADPVILKSLICAAVVVVGFIVYMFVHDALITVFSAWDAVVSWNRWAIDWAHGIFPKNTWHYPQLLPANWSLSYVFMQTTTVQMFAKLLMPLFPLTVLAALYDLWRREQRWGYLLALSVTPLLLVKLMASGNFSGYADVPVACTAFAAVYLLLISRASGSAQLKKNFILGALIASAAALTKQAGLFMVLIYPCFVLCILKDRSDLTRVEKYRLMVGMILLMIVIVFPWYTYKQIQISQGGDSSEVPYVTQGIFHGISYFERGLNAFLQFVDKLGGWFIFSVVTILLVASVSVYAPALWILSLIVLPYFCIWAFFYSYDMRNVALIVPFLGLLSGFGLEALLRLKRVKHLWARYSFIVLTIAVSGGVLQLEKTWNDDRLLTAQVNVRKQVGDVALNHFLYQFLDQNKINGKILTNYFVLDQLPLLDQYCQRSYYANLKDFLQEIKAKDVTMLLIDKGNVDPKIMVWVDHKTKTREYQTLFNSTQYLMMRRG